MSGAISSEGIYTLPKHAIKTDIYKCLCCNEVLIFRKGDINVPHFSHKAKSSAKQFLSNTSGESIEHITAKDLLCNILMTQRSLAFRKKCPCGVIECVSLPPLKDVRVEYRTAEKISFDVGGMTEWGEIYGIEVFKTHRQYHRPHNWFEVQADTVIETYSTTSDNIFDCIRSWFCSTCEQRRRFEMEEIDKLHKERELQKRIADEEAEFKQEQLRRKQEDERKDKYNNEQAEIRFEVEKHKLHYDHVYKTKYIPLVQQYKQDPSCIPTTESVRIDGYDFLHPSHVIRYKK